jgi:diguanylate cyclase (GGDEF)-like protein
MSNRRREAALQAELARLRLQVRVDGVTMLGDQRAFEEDLDRELMRAERTGQPLCLIVLNVDAEPWTQRTGDEHRRALAKAMRASVRGVDLGYRIGTDEFALILPDTRARGGLVAARRVVSALRATGALQAWVSAGVAEAGPGIDRRQLFRSAYVALLAVGRGDRERIRVYSPELEPPGMTTGPKA